MSDDFSINPSTNVGALLDRFPELEDIIIEMAPPFKKLRNPILRRSVAKVASLQQAAAVGRVSVDVLVNKLRTAVGQAPIDPDQVEQAESYFTPQPYWFDPAQVIASLDERTAGDQMPLVTVLQKANRLQPTEILELVTTFLPAPGIDIMKGKGFLVWSTQEDPALIRTYFSKPADS